jgi:hypothetical protein
VVARFWRTIQTAGKLAVLLGVLLAICWFALQEENQIYVFSLFFAVTGSDHLITFRGTLSKFKVFQINAGSSCPNKRKIIAFLKKKNGGRFENFI